MHRTTIIIGGLLAAAIGALAACETQREKKKAIFQFDGPDVSPREIVETDPPLKGKDATYRVPGRRQILTVAPSYTLYHHAGIDPVFGHHESSGEIYHEEVYPSDYFLERSGEPILPDGAQGLYFEARLSHVRLPAEGGAVWARVNVAAPSFLPAGETGLNIALVLDLSDSMESAEKIDLCRIVAKSLVSQLLPDDRLSVVTSGGSTRVLRASGAAANREELLSRIDRLAAAGGDDIGAGIHEGYLQVEAGRAEGGGAGHVILVSDGLLPGGGWRVEELARQKHAQGYRLSAIGVGEDVDAGLLISLARAGEGRFAYIPGRDGVGEVLAREMRTILRAYARNVRLLVESPGVKVLAAYGPGILNPSPGGREIALADFVPSDDRSLLFRLQIPALGLEGYQDIKFKLFYTQMRPVRRTTREAMVRVEGGRTFEGEDAAVRIHARLATGIDFVRRALEEVDSTTSARTAISMLEGEFPSWKATVFAEGDRDLMRLATLFEEFAGRLRGLQAEGKLQRRTPERERLRSEFYYRHG
ncbi:MAG: VWA domain-containing protein [Planctomycetes bacterium]|nr:VWA domain-containing protein [Planctomycetota bacterium]